MKVKLVNAIFDKVRMSEPIGLCYLAAVLRNHGYKVDIIDPRIEPLSVETTVDLLMRNPFDVLGISTFSFQIEQLYRLINLTRKAGFQGKIVLGGLGPTLCAERYLSKSSQIDAIVLGEGEVTFLELIRALERDQKNQSIFESWKSLEGLVYRNGGEIVSSGFREVIDDLDDLPFMARDILEQNIAKYGREMVFAAVLAGRGCFYNCSYCWIASALNLQKGPRYRQRSISSVLDELEFLRGTYGIRKFSFEDDNFIVPGKKGIERAYEFRDGVQKRKLDIEFFFQTRPDTISREAIGAYKDAGLTKLFIGIEAISEDDLKLYNKRHAAGQIEEVLFLLRDFDFLAEVGRENKGRVRFGYITFHPLTTLRSIRESLDFFKKFNLTPKRFMKHVNLFDGGMDIKRAFETAGLISTDGTHFNFRDPIVGVVYEIVKTYADRVFSIRERIRSVEKHTFRKHIAKDEIVELVRSRHDLDGRIFDFTEKLLNIAEEHEMSVNEIQNRGQELLLNEQADLEKYIEDHAIETHLQEAYERYGVHEEMYDLYW